MYDLWHGGMRWVDPPCVQPSRPNRYEGGPGIYLTTHYQRARSYARGKNVVTRVTISPPRWLEDVTMPCTELLDFVARAPRVATQKRKLLREYILHSFRRQYPEQGEDLSKHLRTEQLLNLCVNTAALPGKLGPYLAEWLVERGIDASLQQKSGDEQWVVVFNPKIIQRYRVAPASTPVDEYSLPPFTR